MKNIKRILLATLLVVPILLLFAFPASASGTDNITAIKTAIEDYFSAYYTGIENSAETFVSSAERVENTLGDTTSTYQFVTFYKWTKALLTELGLTYQNCNTDIDYSDISISDNVATASVSFGLNYNYEFSPKIQSSISDIQYIFTLACENGKWEIIGIQSDWLDYRLFQEELTAYVDSESRNNTVLKNRASTSAITASEKSLIDNFLAYKINDINLMEAQAISYADKLQSVDSTQNANSARASHSYSASNGATYATTYATTSASDRLFYTASVTGGDCTNFVSQCVWAAYGGYDPLSISTTQSNISSKKRMVSSSTYDSGWYAGTGGGSANWEQVNKFYSYVTSSKTYGPNGTGINNGKKWSSYPNYYNSIPVGTVIQLHNSGTTEYQHSVYTTGVTTNPTPDSTYGFFKTVLVSYHSSDTLNRSLMELIAAFGGSNCYMRGISFASASFSS